MDLSNLSERDRETVEKNESRRSDIKIVRGLKAQGKTDKEIAELMGTTELNVRTIIKTYPNR